MSDADLQAELAQRQAAEYALPDLETLVSAGGYARQGTQWALFLLNGISFPLIPAPQERRDLCIKSTGQKRENQGFLREGPCSQRFLISNAHGSNASRIAQEFFQQFIDLSPKGGQVDASI